MKDLGTVTIIIPVYNKERHLRNCLNSVLNQTYKNLEIIIVDDGSTDKSAEIIKEYIIKDSRIISLIQNNSGASLARNAGINRSTGKYIQFVDADDYVSSKSTEKLLENIVRSGSDLVVCGYYQVINKKVVGSIHYEKECTIKKEDYFRLIDTYHLDPLCGSPCNRIIRADILKNNNIYYKAGISFAEDFTFDLDTVSCINTITIIKDCLYYYNLDVSSSLSKVTRSSIDESWKQQTLFIDYFRQSIRKLEAFRYKYLADTIYFALLADSLLQRIRSRSYSNPKELCSWVKDNISKCNLHLVRIRDGRESKDYNSRKRKVIMIYQKIFLAFCNIGHVSMFVKGLLFFRNVIVAFTKLKRIDSFIKNT